ncbi:hypothetical protein ACH5Y9_21005 [Methylomonas sp. BW4-1]|uniref:hypothetical protein n=1 Tax=Methylomonas sp. BW4-1 TaxID=3376685 RepID=UPI004042694E
MEFFLKEFDTLSHLDVREPIAWILYLGILSILLFQYYREGSDVFREYGRLHREILKEQSLKDIYTDTWKQRIKAATHLFNIDNWLILTSFLLLIQFLGLMILLQNSHPQNNSKFELQNVSSSFQSAVVGFSTIQALDTLVSDPVKSKSANTGKSQNRTPRAEAQYLLGMAFIVFCIAVALLVNRAKFVALRIMYEFACQNR